MDRRMARFSGIRLRDVKANAFMTQEDLQKAINILERYGDKEYTDPVSKRRIVVDRIKYRGDGTYQLTYQEWKELGTPMFLKLDINTRAGVEI
jgi:hypothetical protein